MTMDEQPRKACDPSAGGDGSEDSCLSTVSASQVSDGPGLDDTPNTTSTNLTADFLDETMKSSNDAVPDPIKASGADSREPSKDEAGTGAQKPGPSDLTTKEPDDQEKRPWRPTEKEFHQFYSRLIDLDRSPLNSADTIKREIIELDSEVPLRRRITYAGNLSFLLQSYLRLVDDR